MNREEAIKNLTSLDCRRALTAGALTAMLLLAILLVASRASGQPTAGTMRTAKTSVSVQDAVRSLIDAEKYYEKTLDIVFASDGGDITAGESARDSEKVKEFAARHTKMSLSLVNKTRAILLVGEDEWPFPIPVVKSGNKWFFDTRAGRQELLFRRVGRNDLDKTWTPIVERTPLIP